MDRRHVGLGLVAAGLVGILGCQGQPKGGSSAGTAADPMASALTGRSADPAPAAREAELAQQVETSREAYHRHLLTLRDFYAANGFEAKRKWAEFELKGLGQVKAYQYAAPAPAAGQKPGAPDGDAGSGG